MTDSQLRILNAFPPPPKLIGAGELREATGISRDEVLSAVWLLELDGWLESEWENAAPSSSRPRRRLFRLTDAGLPTIAGAARGSPGGVEDVGGAGVVAER